MREDTVVRFQRPEAVEDPLTELLRGGAQRLIQQAVEAELAELLAQFAGETDAQGRCAVVRNGYLPERGADRDRTGAGERGGGPTDSDSFSSWISVSRRIKPPALATAD